MWGQLPVAVDVRRKTLLAASASRLSRPRRMGAGHRRATEDARSDVVGNSVAQTRQSEQPGFMEIRRFGPDDTGDVTAALEIRNAAVAVDSPWEFSFPAHRFDALLRKGWDGEPPAAYLAVADGHPVSTSLMF